ncbi:efflux RND transporter permease subunit [Pseudomaricurvus alkylphenolicus]|uniref:efflux RND transporter permease subunit n=1 Tax=Pseudomaricurvus alkylphenolicus TaxID=1306991 RepID=UPI00198195C4|nr:efflux RND transporter permease subunit [Pseudomaricurvus alkylphenolicus]
MPANSYHFKGSSTHIDLKTNNNALNLTQSSLKNPAALIVIIALVITFGLLSILKLPTQLLPDIERPQITITTSWRAAAPEEMESVIIEPQENVLKNTVGIDNMTSSIQPGFGEITLTFNIGTDMQEAMLNVINNLNQAPALPLDADEPIVTSGAGRDGITVASLLVKALPGSGIKDLGEFQQLIEDVVEPRLKQVKGVSKVNLNSRRPREVRIEFDPHRLASLQLQLGDIVRAVARSTDASGGFADVGRRKYTVRFAGQYDLNSLDQMIIGWSDQRPIYLADVASVRETLADATAFTLRNGDPAYYLTLNRASGANTVELLDAVNRAIAELNQGPLAQVQLALDLSFDSSVHIRNAIALVQSNLGLGVILALVVLWLFLRGVRTTLLIALTIPVSLMVSFLILNALGRSLNVISLAGLAFAVGMVLDAAIIVQENIVRLRLSGAGRTESVLRGATQVTPALFASTVTSVAIFLPILFMQGIEAQLFSDLAIALSSSVIASLLVAITVLPVASHYWLSHELRPDRLAKYWDRLTRLIMLLTNTNHKRRLWIGGLLLGSVVLVLLLLPKADFLPRAPTDGFYYNLDMPAGGNLAFIEEEISRRVVERITPFMHGEAEPPIKSYNFYSFGAGGGGFIYSEDPLRTEELMAVAREKIFSNLPDTQYYLFRGSMLDSAGVIARRAIDIDIQGSDIESLMAAAVAGQNAVKQYLNEATSRPVPGLDLQEPELRLIPKDRRITQSGVDRQTIADAVRAMTSGLFVSEYFDGNDRLNVILRGETWSTPEQLAELPIHTPLAGIQTLGELTTMTRTVGPSELRRVDAQRTVTLEVSPPTDMPLEVALELISDKVLPEIQAQLPEDAGIRLSGSADQLQGAIQELSINFVSALFILFLIMAALFRSAIDSMIVLTVMPVAAAGGTLSLWLLNLVTYQSLDLLTMIGFIILLGLVVNNAILLVDHTRRGEAEGLNRTTAVAQAVRLRARPVYMSTLTSLFGMLPLMIVPGVGAEIYRGLAAVIVGGLAVSAVFTLVLLPSLLQLGQEHAVAEKSNSSGNDPSPSERAAT